MRQPEGVDIAGQPLDAYPTGPEATAPAAVRFALNRTA
jgi:hypothetical protein